MADPRKDVAAVRLIGGAMCAAGVLFVIPSLVMLLDRTISVETVMCSVVFGLPLLVSGASRLLRPGRY